ncbi:MAG: calcium-binding protein [Cypionkella sp.]|uniref:calcium-binding protein n=1 Tax=Cypionkella sp. TaxID=2811411 RepID=UPI002ABC43D4|nr:calcium-binding protein [Cypionkella sp.]MDZ4311688.1 calcium-binding protein [Cypionkella sp.]
MAEPSITRTATGTVGDDLLSVRQLFVAGELIASGAVRSYETTLTAYSGDDTLTGWQGPANWPNFFTTALPGETLAVRSVLLAGNGQDTLISAKRFAGLTAAQDAAYTLAETLSGGFGNDSYELNHTDVTVIEVANGGVDQVLITPYYVLRAAALGLSGIDMALLVNIENLTVQGGLNFDVEGSDLANKIYGNLGINHLRGGLGADTLYGGGGADQLWGDSGALIGIGSDDRLFGGTGADSLWGEAGNDYLDSGYDNDCLYGGDGDDTQNGNVGDDSLFGGDGGDSLIGLNGFDWLSGDAGNDQLYGGRGADLLWGGDGDDVLHGGTEDDTLDGGSGNDLLADNAGDDLMSGGLGDDIYIVDSAADQVIELAGEGNDIVRASLIALSGGDFAHVETLQLQGSQDLDLSGGGQVLRMIGNAGRNTLTTGGMDGESLYGGAGDDVLLALTALNRVELYGGSGNDRYFIYDSALDHVHEAAGQGFDVVETDSASLDASTGADYGQNIEVLRLLGAAQLDLTGGGSVVQLEGNAGANRLTGGSNAEQIFGGAGSDTLDGGAGDDTLSGGADTDELHGGSGNDCFVFDLIDSGGVDYLDDFEAGDVLDLHAAAQAVGVGVPLIGAGFASYNGMTVFFYEFDFDGDGSADLAFYARNEIVLSELLAGFG